VRHQLLGGLAVLLTGLPVAALEPAPAGISAADVARRAEDNLRSDRTYFEARMNVESPRLSRPRSVRFQSWEDRAGKRSFIRIHEPAKDTGTGFLKLGANLWMYIPRVERTMRIPPSMMLQSWMGSDFTNDDLVKESSEIDDYDHRWVGVEPALEAAGGRRAYVIEYVPHEVDVLVHSVAVDEANPERVEARRRGLPCLRYVEAPTEDLVAGGF